MAHSLTVATSSADVDARCGRTISRISFPDLLLSTSHPTAGLICIYRTPSVYGHHIVVTDVIKLFSINKTGEILKRENAVSY